jgi:hypothetical protein
MKTTGSRRIFSLLSASIPSVAFLSMAMFVPQAHAQDENLFFASDFHNEPEKLKALITASCINSYFCETVGIVGDFGAGMPTQESDWFAVQLAINEVVPYSQKIFSQGNHDENTTYYSHDSGLVSFAPDGGGEEHNKYYDVFVIDVKDFNNGTALSTLKGISNLCSQNSKVLFVMSHYPLHSLRNGIDQSAAKNIFNFLQTCSDGGRDVVFLWGHNHRKNSSGVSYDDGVDYIVTAGGKIGGSSSIIGVADQNLKFTYLNAGYILPKESNSTSSATNVTVDLNKIIVRRYQDPKETVTVNRKGSTCGNGSCDSSRGENSCSCSKDCGYHVAGSCAGHCGGNAGQCWCDWECLAMGDCCADMQPVCGCRQ